MFPAVEVQRAQISEGENPSLQIPGFTEKVEGLLQYFACALGFTTAGQDATLIHQCDGEAAAIAAFSKWLSEIGSPKSKVKRAEIVDAEDVGELPKPFEIRR